MKLETFKYLICYQETFVLKNEICAFLRVGRIHVQVVFLLKTVH